MYKKIINLLVIIFFITSCSSMDSVRRGLTGEKAKTTDEFFIQKKDPLILPPDYENLPIPDESIAAAEEISNFEKSLGSSIDEDSSTYSSDSAEESILKKIQSK